MFDKILIANRGEIACRIIRTCRHLGVSTVAVYSSADRNALHVAMADEAVRIGAAPSSESYLNIDAVIDAARRTGARAVHPGYGFLSENADFAAACAAAELVFIGPSPEAIRAMGSKAEAKRIMAEAGVPVLPGDTSPDQDDAALIASAASAGYPVMVKPAAGGGGRGMRVVRAAEGLPDALASARREALSSFGDDTLLIEKLVENPRHIEVQVFGDRHGNVVHLFERDCSAQRRHQKVVEEAPARGLPDEIRAGLFDASVAAAKAVGYVGAGTVEFLLGPDGDFWFMEMNTRLQVEHPVTEQITGIDLVEWQLRVAAGEPLPRTQDAVTATGNAIEVRLYAEDPANDFAPGFGKLVHLDLPPDSTSLRIDTGVTQGDAVTVHYDPMIAKIIATGDSREDACKTMSAALGSVRIVGPATNESFLKAIVDHAAFRTGGLDTGFIARHIADLASADESPPSEIVTLAALAELSRPGAQPGMSPWASASGWRLGRGSQRRIAFVIDGNRTVFRLTPGGLYREGDLANASGRWISDTRFEASVDGEQLSATVVRNGSSLTVFAEIGRFELSIDDPLNVAVGAGADGGSLFAHMPGVVVAVHVEDGAEVVAGTPLLAVEAMKVEHTIRAPADGTVTRVNFAEGDRVAEGAELVSFSPATP
ncbi:MAG: acetyl/propionyl/methylcrotonyl-CoA carboxylase subunit alpha [Alphaproteobacteria bacterium]